MYTHSLSATSSTKKQTVNMDNIRSKLNFSSNRSPLVIRSSYSKISPPSNRRLSDYHMSRQNPAVLDHLVGNSSDLSPTIINSSPHDIKLNNSLPKGGGIISPFWPQPVKLTSVVKRYSPLNDGRSSIVQLATNRSTPFRYSQTSPIMVKLAYSDKKNEPSHHSTFETNSSKESIKKTPLNPCDKNVVVSALKDKRKRWWSSVTVSPPNGCSSNGIMDPLSKKPKTTQDFGKRNREEEERPSLITANEQLSDSESSRPLKKTKHVANINNNLSSSSSHIGRRPKRLILPDMEIEVSPLSSPVQSVTERKRKDNGENDKVIDEKKRRSDTPPVDEEETSPDQKERILKLKREATLKLNDSLTKVFPSPSSTRGASIRKKVPILCTTGSKPHMVLHDQLSATQEALKKDKETVSNRIKSFLMSDDPDEPKDDQIVIVSSNQVGGTIISSSLPISSVSQSVSYPSLVIPIIPPASVDGLNTTTSLKLPSLNIKFPEIKNPTSVNTTTTSVSINSSLPTQPSLQAQSSLLPQSSLHSLQTSLSAPLSLSSQTISFSTPRNLVNSSLNTGLQQQQQQQQQQQHSLTTPVLTLNPQQQQQQHSLTTPVLTLNPQQQQQQQQSSTLTLRQTPSLGFSVASTVVTASISNPIVAFSNLSTPNLGTISNSVVSSIGQPTGTTGSGKGLSLLGGFTVPTTSVASGGITMKTFSLSQSLTAATANTTLTIGNGGLQSGSFNFGLNQQSSSIFANKTNTNQQQQQGVMSATQTAAPKPLTNIFNSQPILNQSANSLGTNLQQQNNAFNPLQTTSVVNNNNIKPSFNLGIAATTTQLPPVGINKDSGFKISLGTDTTNVFNSQQPQMSFGNGLFNQTQQQLPAVTTTTAQTTQSAGFQFSLNKSQGVSPMFGGMGQQQPQMQATSSTSFQFSKMAAANSGGGNTLGLTGTNNGGLGLAGTNNGNVGGSMSLTGNMANGGLGLTSSMGTNNGGLGLIGNTLSLSGNMGTNNGGLGLTGNMAANNGGLGRTGNVGGGMGLTGNMTNGGLGRTGNTLSLTSNMGTNNGGLGLNSNVGGGMGLTGNMGNGGLGRTGNTLSLTSNMGTNNGGLGLNSNVGGGMGLTGNMGNGGLGRTGNTLGLTSNTLGLTGNMANGGLGLASNKLGQQQPPFAFGSTNSQQKPQNMLQSGNPAFNFTMGKQENQTGMFNQNTASSSFVNQNAHPNGMTQGVPGTPFGGNQSTNQNQFFQFGNKGTSTNTAGGIFSTNQSISNQPNSSFQFQSTQPSQSGFNFGTVETTPSRGVSFSAGKPRQTIQARRRKK